MGLMKRDLRAGYANHSAISKRLARIRRATDAYFRQAD
jgi:hypothetical protein